MQIPWRRLWQPRKPLFWLAVAFNVMSSLCAWGLRNLPLSAGAALLLGSVGLLNVGFGLLAAWRLVREEPAARPPKDERPGPLGPSR